MAVYLKIFPTMSAYEDFITNTADYPKPNISYIEATDEVIFTNYRDITSIEFDNNTYSIVGNEESAISVPFSVIDNWGDDVTENCTFTFSPNDKGLYVDNGYIKVDSAIEGIYDVTITATLGDFTASATIAMQIAAIPHSISFNSNSYTLSGDEGTSITTSYTVKDDLNNDVTSEAVITFDNAYVTANNGTFSVASGVTAGTYTTVATATVGSLTTTATINITVVAVPTSISFDSNSYTMSGTEGDTITQSYTVTNDLNQDVTSQAVITFSPSNTGITASNGTFNASSVSAGSYTITATATVGNLTTTATINLTVAAVPTSIAFDSNSYTLSGTEYDTIQQQFAVTDNLGNDVSYQCSYSMSPNDTDLVITDNAGEYYEFDASSVSAGTYTVTVTATYGNLTTTTTVSMNISSAQHDYSKDYLTFEALESGTFTLTIPAAVDTNYMTSVSYSTDNGTTWTTTAVDNTAQTITTPTIAQGDKVLWKGIGNALSVYDYSIYNTKSSSFSSTGNFNIEGNVMSMLYGDNFVGQTALPSGSTYTFGKLFNNSKVIGASNLCLAATTLVSYCYYYMFGGCTNLTTAPALPATTLSNYCYEQMFNNCTSLTTSPMLPSTTLAAGCYQGMFNGSNALPDCTNIDFTSQTVIANQGLRSLFEGTKVTDSDLMNILPINQNTNNYWLPSTTLAQNCYRAMFKNCTSLTTAPELPATALAVDCYFNMFNGCTNLNFIKALFLTTPSGSYTGNWVNGVAASGTFVKNAEATWDVSGTNGIPTNWTVVDAS